MRLEIASIAISQQAEPPAESQLTKLSPSHPQYIFPLMEVRSSSLLDNILEIALC
jgi:hypothetical protein